MMVERTLSSMADKSSFPQIFKLLERLSFYEVSYVLIGSAAAMLHGADIQPGDVDITPALDRVNLARLGEMLESIDAKPTNDFGFWQLEAGERRWVVTKPTQKDLEERADWKPDPKDKSSFDFSYNSNLGNFDVVPDLMGDYSYLLKRAVSIQAYELVVNTAHIDDLLATLTIPRRSKDKERVASLRTIQRKGNSSSEEINVYQHELKTS